MKFLHTSDWHLNEKLGQVDRQPDIHERLVEIARYIDQERVDVMLVSGDLISSIARLDEVSKAFADVANLFRPFLARGGTMIAISGNHDSEHLFKMFRLAMDLAAPQERAAGVPKLPGRLYIFDRPGYMSLANPTGGEVQFVMLPYPDPSRYLRDDQMDFRTVDERNQLLHRELTAQLRAIQDSYVRPQHPTILVSHLHVRGNRLHNLYRLSESRDVVFDHADLPLEWAYNAFGHIHLPQDIRGNPRARYAGSIERFDFAEAEDAKSVVLFEVGRGGVIGAPLLLPLNATPLYRIEVHCPEEIASLADRYPEAARSIVDISIQYKPGVDNPDAMRDALEEIFPRWYRRKIEAEGDELVEEGSGDFTAPVENVTDTVRAYLNEKLAGNSDREELLALAEELLASL